MDWWMLAVGAVLVVVAAVDAVSTSLSPSTRAGPLTGATTAAVWAAISRIPGGIPRVTAGPLILTLTAGSWLLLWVGWALIFSADPSAVVEASTGQPADLSGRFFFAAYTVFTLGLGNYVPAGSWENIASLALINGLGLATLAITYLVPVVTAVTDRRRQAAFIACLGSGPSDIVRNTAEGGFAAIGSSLPALTRDILLTGERHLTYPVMHYFRGIDERSALPVQLAALDDALFLIQASEHRLDPGLVRQFRAAVDSLLDLRATEDRDIDAPPVPDFGLLDDLGIANDAERLSRDLKANRPRRLRLQAYLERTDWRWPQH
ncbi:MAG: potassium channel family protein [Actinobacteria bacterium]|nr:potassium channel family protein [Actinomycetota bacterium]